jgi:predicted Zn-dependent peptidase
MTNNFPERTKAPVKFAHKAVSSPVAHCSLSIGVGTRDEKASQNGIAHYLEHMFFKGTATKSAATINSALEKLGGELNAYTTKEETVIHATTLKEDLPKALELISDMVFNSVFPEKEMEKERDIILEEIASYKDTPSELIFEDFDAMVFNTHPLGRPILGSPSTVKRISTGNIREFSLKHYLPGNMSLSVVGDIPEIKLLKLVERNFGQNKGYDWNTIPEEAGTVNLRNASRGLRERVVKKRTHQTHCIVGAKAYTLYDDRRVPMALLTNILGGPALNSRLNILLRERNALVYTVDATYTPYKDTGLFTIYFGTDKNSLSRSTDIIMKELSILRDREISPARLKAAKKQLIGQMAISMENGENQCLSMGKSLLAYNKVEHPDQINEKIMSITAQELQQVAGEVFNEQELYTLVYK